MGARPSGLRREYKAMPAANLSAIDAVPGGPPSGTPDPAPAKPNTRPTELQDPLNLYIYHPLARRLARALSHTPVTPNMVSVFGGLMVVAAGVIYWGMDPWGWAWPTGALTGMALHLGWHVVDGADGDLARMTGRASPIGEIVDGICDYASHIVMYFLLAAVLQRSIGGFAWPIMVAAGVSHVVQSNHVEVERRFYLAWMYGVPWLHHTQTKANGLTGMMQVFRPGVALYMRLAAGLTPRAAQIDATVSTAAGDANKLARIRTIIGEERRPLLPLLKIMGPNPRAIVLGLGMLAGSPVWFFVYQALVLNALMALSLVLHDRAAQRIGVRLAADGLLESS